MKPSASPGPDGSGTNIIKNVNNPYITPLLILKRKFLAKGETPEIFMFRGYYKLVNITPVFKEGSKKEPKNSLPISQTSIIEIFERLLEKTILGR